MRTVYDKITLFYFVRQIPPYWEKLYLSPFI